MFGGLSEFFDAPKSAKEGMSADCRITHTINATNHFNDVSIIDQTLWNQVQYETLTTADQAA